MTCSILNYKRKFTRVRTAETVRTIARQSTKTGPRMAVLMPLAEVDEDDFHFQMNVNVYGPYRVTRALFLTSV